MALCEANPSSTRRLAGEWLHPPAIQVLRDFGTDLPSAIPEHAGVLSAEAFEGAANGVRSRRTYGRDDRFLVRNAIGYHHSLTAIGMALGFKDALCLAHCQSVAESRARRPPASRVVALLVVGLYEALRKAPTRPSRRLALALEVAGGGDPERLNSRGVAAGASGSRNRGGVFAPLPPPDSERPEGDEGRRLTC